MTKRRIGWLLKGCIVSKKTGAPRGIARGSIAILRPGLNGTPKAPIGPRSWLADGGNSLKNTKRGFALSISWTLFGLRFAHSEIPCIVASARVISFRSNSHCALDLKGWSLVPAKPKRTIWPPSNRIFPDPWICIDAAATGSSTQAISEPFSKLELNNSARVGAGFGFALTHDLGYAYKGMV